jgi:hypothetical protein
MYVGVLHVDVCVCVCVRALECVFVLVWHVDVYKSVCDVGVARVPVTEQPGLQPSIIKELLLAVKDVGPYVETFTRLLQEFERRTMIR